MKLIDLYEQILLEQESEVFELPNDNFTVSVFRSNKKILFTPQQHSSVTGKVRSYINTLKQNFKVTDVKDLSDGSFELILDPRENIDELMNFLKTLTYEQGYL